MARKPPDLGGIFQKTEPQPAAEEAPAPAPTSRRGGRSADDRTLPVGVGLKESELRELDAIKENLGIARNELMRFAIRHFLAEYRAGKIPIEIEREERRRIKGM